MPRPIGFELGGPDPEKTAAFYEQALGWLFTRSADDSDVWEITTGSRTTPGIDGRLVAATYAPQCLLIVRVDNLDEAVTRVVRAGGAIVRHVTRLDGLREVHCSDPAGVVFALVEE